MPWKLNPFTGDFDQVMSPGDGVAVTSVTTDSGSATADGDGQLTISGGTGMDTSATGNTVTVTLTNPVDVTLGGTGVASLTDGGILLGSGTSDVTVTGQPTDGQLLIGDTDSDPSLATLTAGTGMTVTNAAGSITLDAAGGVAMSFPTDSGTATPAANIVTLAGGTGLNTSGSGSTATFNLDVEATVSLNTGLITGGILSVGTPPNKFSITDGNGVVLDCTTDPLIPTVASVSWTGKTDIVVTAIGSQLITFVLIDNAGSVIQQSTSPSHIQRRTHIPLGVIVHVDLVNVDAVNNEQQPCINLGPQLYDLMDGLGFFNVSGNIFSANAAANLTFDKSVGDILKSGSNWNTSPQNPHILTLASLAILSFQYRFQDGTNGATGTVIDPDIYDNGGVSTSVPNNKFTIQRIYSFISNNVKIQPGQILYNSLAEAKGGIQTESFVTEPSILANGLLRGFLCVKKGTSDLTDTTKAVFLSAAKFGGTAGTGGLSVSTLQNVYDNSINPEIVINSTNGALTIQDASSPIGANLFEVQSNGGGSTFFNVTVSGVDIDGALTLTTALAVSEGGTGLSSTVANELLYSSATSTIAGLTTANDAVLTTNASGVPAWLALANDGELLIGSTAGTAAAATITAGAGISVGVGSNSITISNTAGGFTWTTVTGATQALAVQNGYVGNRGTNITYTLPSTAAVGEAITILNFGAGLPVIAQNAGESINFVSSSTTVGVGGSLTGVDQFGSIELVCIVADTTWTVVDSTGSWTIV